MRKTALTTMFQFVSRIGSADTEKTGRPRKNAEALVLSFSSCLPVFVVIFCF
jgi:hypothetical protein